MTKRNQLSGTTDQLMTVAIATNPNSEKQQLANGELFIYDDRLRLIKTTPP